MPESMTSRERVLAALRGEAVDRTPVVNPTSIATVELMDLVDAPFPHANRDPELMAALAATGYTELGFDSIMPVFSIIQESSALGARIQWEQKDNWPTVKMTEPIYADPSDIDIRPDVLDHPDAQCVLEAIRILRRRFGDEVAIIGKSMGPWSTRLSAKRWSTGRGREPAVDLRGDHLRSPGAVDRAYARNQLEPGGRAVRALPTPPTQRRVTARRPDSPPPPAYLLRLV